MLSPLSAKKQILLHRAYTAQSLRQVFVQKPPLHLCIAITTNHIFILTFVGMTLETIMETVEENAINSII